ncbi:MAG: hypothetical protein D6708_11110 [Candidatus Dadabacteria bacterium]|nr:MAG: hypothetical protein D6708_11110 [Candidatus Dadabacteria bacterium]
MVTIQNRSSGPARAITRPRASRARSIAERPPRAAPMLGDRSTTKTHTPGPSRRASDTQPGPA